MTFPLGLFLTPRSIQNFFQYFIGAATLALILFTPSGTQTAVANGDTRTIYLHHAHTNESIAATYLVNGQYDSAVLKQLNWFLRDWRRDEPTNMDPRLFDVVWEAYRGAGAANQEINVVSAYRSPETNAMLRSRSRAVAKYSQHMLGKAMDTTMPGMPMAHIREVGMRMQRGGVGYYPTAGTPFVHLDVGNVRHWPRMSYDQLAALFPDGKTVHIPSNGQPLARYEEARAEIEARGDGAFVTAPRFGIGNFFARLFGGGGEEEDSEVAAPPPPARKQWGLVARKGRGAPPEAEVTDEGAAAPENKEIARAEADLPRGETTLSAPGDSEGGEPSSQPTRGLRVKAPLPPNRPTFLTARLSTNDAPVAPDRALSLAALGNNATSEEASDELAPASVRGRLVKAPTPPRRPSALSAARGNKAGMQARQAKFSPDSETPGAAADETTERRRESKATRKPEQAKLKQDKLMQDKLMQAKAQQEKSKPEKAGLASPAAVEKEEVLKKPAAKAPAPARSPAASASAKPATVAPLGGLRAAARGASSPPAQ